MQVLWSSELGSRWKITEDRIMASCSYIQLSFRVDIEREFMANKD